MKFTLVAPSTDHLVDREYNAGLGAGFSIGPSIPARLLEWMRRLMGETPLVQYGYIAAILAQHGHDVMNSDRAPEDGVMVIAPSLPNFGADLEAIKQGSERPGVRVIVTGTLASVRPQEFSPYADLVIRGEPESIFMAMDKNDIPTGVVDAKPVANLDSLPFPDWSMFNHRPRFFSFIFGESRYAFVQASRSCPYTCGYCPYVITNSYRQRSVANVIAELSHLYKTCGVRGIVFRDPTFTARRAWVIEFCEALASSDLSIRWECETRLDRLDTELLQVMRACGLNSLKVGIESASAEVLRRARRKPISLLHQEQILRTCSRLGVAVAAFYVLGLPGDTEESVRATIDYAQQLNTDAARFHIFTPIPGTTLYEEERDKIFEVNWEKFDLFHVVYRHENLSEDTLYRLKEQAFVSYYFRPRYVARTLARMISKRASWHTLPA